MHWNHNSKLLKNRDIIKTFPFLIEYNKNKKKKDNFSLIVYPSKFTCTHTPIQKQTNKKKEEQCN
jgi:hypothetical protein